MNSTHESTYHGSADLLSKKDATAADAEFLGSVETTTCSTRNLHRSHLLRLQMEQLARECELNLTEAHHVQWAGQAHDYVLGISNLLSSQAVVGGATLTPHAQQNCPFCWQSDRAAQGSLSVELKQKLVVSTGGVGLVKAAGNAHVLPTLQLLVQLPACLLEPKDYLRNRYFDKRNLVVWHVAQFLSQPQYKSTVGKVYWEYQYSDPRKPVLLLVPADDSKKAKRSKQQSAHTKRLRFRVQILFGIESIEWMASPLRLVPNRCNLALSDDDTQTLWSTDKQLSQYYNHTLMEDAAAHWLLDHDKQDYPHMHDVCLLVQVWALKRGLLRNHDGWTEAHIALLVLYLYKTKQANPRMAPPQVLAALFKLLAATNWLGDDVDHKSQGIIRKAPSDGYVSRTLASDAKRTVLIMPKDGCTVHQTVAQSKIAQIYEEQTRNSPITEQDPPTLLELYASCRHYTLGPVFLDPTMSFNYLGRLSPSFMRLLQREARQSLDCLHSQAITKPFDYLFRINGRFWDRFDAYMKIPLSSVSFGKSTLWGRNRHDTGDYECVARSLVDVLTLALGDRVRAIRLQSTGNGSVAPVSKPNGYEDSDAIPRHEVQVRRDDTSLSDSNSDVPPIQSPIGTDFIVLGISVNPDTCYRMVDRGPPADDLEATKAFLNLWGRDKAELRRFKDGAIVHAVVWGTTMDASDVQNDKHYIQFQNDDKIQGGIVERIVRHVLQLHFLANDAPSLQFSLRNMTSIVDSVVHYESPEQTAFLNPTAAHRMIMKAFDALATFLQKHSTPTIPVAGTSEMKSRLDIPLAIDAVEPLAPALRYAELFPPLPHPFLGGASLPGMNRVSGAVQTEPIKIQIRFGASSKWPSDLRAIGAAKTAMLIQLVNGIESMKQSGLMESQGFDGPMVVTPLYADIGFMGYVFRILVQADPEIKLLQSLDNPSEEALSQLRYLNQQHVVAATHHTLVHAVYTSHPSSSWVVRMARKWVASHLLSDHIPFAALELLVCHSYTDPTSPLGAPGTLVAGFLRFLSLLAHHDWVQEPLIVDPQHQLTQDDRSTIMETFEKVRGPNHEHGPAMYVVSPTDRSSDQHGNNMWSLEPCWASTAMPEPVVLKRACALAARTREFLQQLLVQSDTSADAWSAAFQETPASFHSYSALFRVDPELLVDTDSSSTAFSFKVRHNSKLGVMESAYVRSMQSLFQGPKALQIKQYRNLQQQQHDHVLLEWNPVRQIVQSLRTHLGGLALVFYNDLHPAVIGCLWRPIPPAHAFSALHSEHVRPVVETNWKSDTLVVRNIHDVLREVAQYTGDVIVDTKVLDEGPQIQGSRKRKSIEKQKEEESDSDDLESD